MNLRSLFNRAGNLPADAWYHLVPKGEFPVSTTDAAVKPVRLMQVLDDTAISCIVNRFGQAAQATNFAGLLIDQDHFSYDPEKSSEAMGWIREVQGRTDGVWGRVEWTDLGNQALTNKRYKFISPVWSHGNGTTEQLAPGRVRPLALETAGLTNSPNLRGMSPLTNRADHNGSADTQPKLNHMKTVATKLGLSAEASEDAVLAAVTQALTARDSALAEVGPLKNRVTELEASVATAAATNADADLLPLKDKITPEELAPLRAGLIANRAATLPLVNRLKTQFAATTATSTVKVLNRQDGKQPNGTPNTDAADPAADQAATAKREGEVETFRLANRCTYDEARNAVRRQKPELFA